MEKERWFTASGKCTLSRAGTINTRHLFNIVQFWSVFYKKLNDISASVCGKMSRGEPGALLIGNPAVWEICDAVSPLLAFRFIKSCGEPSHHVGMVTKESKTENVNIKRNTRRALVNQKRRREPLINQSLVLRSKYCWLANSVCTENRLTNSISVSMLFLVELKSLSGLSFVKVTGLFSYRHAADILWCRTFFWSIEPIPLSLSLSCF